MLVELHIENFAIIDKLDVDLGPGLVTLTGETGAGKSIIIDAVETLLGGRADSTQVRSEAGRSNVEAVFRIPEIARQPVHAILQREELMEDPDYVTLSREIRLNGRNVARVNGRTASAGLLREIGEYLVDVHGQSEHLSLLRVNQHLGLLDRFASTDSDNPLEQLLPAYQHTYQSLQKVSGDLVRLRQTEADAARRIDMLNYQIKEIQAAHLTPGEEEELRTERNRLSNAEGLASLTQEALVSLDEGSPEAPASTDLFGQVLQALASLSRLDPSQSGMHEQAQALFENLSDLARNLRVYQEGIEFNPKRLDQVEERVTLIQSLKRKYGETIPAVLDFASEAQRQLDEVTSASDRIAELEKERDSLLVKLGGEGVALSQARRDAAARMERLIEAELEDLQMAGARFKVDFHQQPDPDGVPTSADARLAYYPQGLERVEFYIAPNPGEGLKPLAKIASGGETSRLMLALKNVLVMADHVPTLIFDEIDQGIGGRVGAVVGRKLWQLARQHQVLCITHLPQLAAFGEQHFHVEKYIQDGRTLTRLKLLQGDDRLSELALMLGTLSENTLQSARELIQVAERRLPPP
jgi:DNA repair protein RecN (Recombination protein N)